VLEDGGPDGGAVGVGEGEGVELVFGGPVEGSLVEACGDAFWFDWREDAEPEHEPVVGVLGVAGGVGVFGDDAEECEVFWVECEADFFVDLSDGAGGGRLAGVLFEFSADG